jgi:hypothetical protein
MPLVGAQEMDLRIHGAVEITLKEGRTLDSGIVERGADQGDRESLTHKFRWLVGHVLDLQVIERLIEAVQGLENLPRAREFTAHLQ